MSLRDAVLAALLDGESSGYDLAKEFDASVANFWMATPQQLYRELDRLAEQGLIQARVVHQERRPNKRMYSLTEAGRDAIRQFTARAPKPSAIRDELMIKIAAADAGDTHAVRDSIAERLQWAIAKRFPDSAAASGASKPQRRPAGLSAAADTWHRTSPGFVDLAWRLGHLNRREAAAWAETWHP